MSIFVGFLDTFLNRVHVMDMICHAKAASMTDVLPDDWKLVKLADSMEAIIDYRGKTPQKTSAGVPLITARVVKEGRILDVEEYIAPDGYDVWMRRGLPQPGDVVITTEAPLGEVAQLDGRKVALAQRLITLRGKPDLLDNTFLKFLLQSEFVRRRSGTRFWNYCDWHQANRTSRGAPANPSYERATCHRPHPRQPGRQVRAEPPHEPHAGGAGHGDLQVVVARSEGRQPFGMAAETAALFPAAFEESEAGPVPAGWRVGTVGDIAQNIRRGVQPNQIDASTPYIGLEHMPQRSIALTEWGQAADVVSGKTAFRKGDILFGKLRPYFHKVGVAPLDGVCSTDIVVVNAQRSEWFGLLLGHLSSVDFINFVNASSEGTRMPRTGWGEMARYQMVIPSPEIRARYSTLVTPLLAKIHGGFRVTYAGGDSGCAAAKIDVGGDRVG